MLSFIAGLMVGGVVGVVTMCLMTVAKEADAHIEDCDYEVTKSRTDEARLPTDTDSSTVSCTPFLKKRRWCGIYSGNF